jgi:SPP1 gp7 family putative phage head morphogenesis protein
VEKGSLLDTSFTLYDAHTVENLVNKRPNLLPKPSPDIPKEMRWHQSKITGAITQGILQGESIPKIAARLQVVTDMDQTAAIRNARTAMTGAQNAGRVDGYKYAESLGIELEQEWLATLDGRTRDSHRLLDGERQKVGDKFSNGCRYPGDPNGAPEEIYNCRCTLVAAIKDIDQSDAPRNSKLEGMTYDEWKFGHDDVKKYEYKVNAAQKKIDKIPNKTYSGIWKDDVTLSDYDAKKGSIAAKETYYQDEINKLESKSSLNGWEQTKLVILKANRAALAEFKTQGEQYSKLSAELKDYKQALKDAKGVTSPFDADAYSDARKKAAHDFSSGTTADKFLRPKLDEQWKDLKDEEKYGVWKYTENSNPMNKPLSGYTDTWSRSDFRGVGNVDWGREDAWRTNPKGFEKYGHANGRIDHAKAIADLTTGIDKCELAEDMWIVRGSDNGGLAGLFEGNIVGFDDVKRLLDRGDIDTLRQVIVGNSFENHAFTSTGIAHGTGFGGEVSYRIYAPAGTKCIYAEPQSYYGATIGHRAALYKEGMSYSGVGGEAEIIVQRGTTYRITGIDMTKSWRGQPNYTVTMEVVDQPNYFKTGYEQTIDGGLTSFKH